MTDILNILKKRKPFESDKEEMLMNLLKTTDVIELELSRLFREFGLTMSQYNVLRILRGEGQPLPCHEIIDRMIQTVPAMTGLLDRLEAQEYLKRERSTEDRRQVDIRITQQGLKLLAEIDAPLHDLNERLMGHLSKSKLKTLSSLLTELRQYFFAQMVYVSTSYW